MHAQAMPLAPERGDERLQRAVLALVLDYHPAQLTRAEIAHEIGEEDDAERAVENLIVAGLLRREGELIHLTPAALYFDLLAA